MKVIKVEKKTGKVVHFWTGVSTNEVIRKMFLTKPEREYLLKIKADKKENKTINSTDLKKLNNKVFTYDILDDRRYSPKEKAKRFFKTK